MRYVGFPPDADFRGRVLDELAALEDKQTIRVLDLLFVRRDQDTGHLVALDYQGEELGAIVGALLGFSFEGDDRSANGTEQVDGHAFRLSEEEIIAFGNALEPGYAGGFLLIEHVWARDLKKALRATGGIPLAEGFLTPEAVAAVAVELVAMAEAMDELQREQVWAGSSS